MNIYRKMTFVLFFVVTVLALNTVVPASGISDTKPISMNESEQITSKFGVEYTVRFDRESDEIFIIAEIQDTQSQLTGFEVRVDGYRNMARTINLSANETWTASTNITRNIDARRNNHTILFNTIDGNTTEFNFTREIHPSNTTEVPTPRITNVEVTNGSPYGQATSVVEVTVENPAEQLYGTKLMVHTLETDHNRRADATAPPGGETTVQIPVEESQGEIIAGEVRLYDNNLSDADHGFDQREFIGEADGETQVWNRTYEPVQDPYGPRSGYVYDNESMAEFVEEEQTREPTPMEHAIAGAGVLVVLLTWWYRR